MAQVELIIESASTLCRCGCARSKDADKRLDVIPVQWPEVSPVLPDHPQFKIVPIGLRVQHGSKLPAL
ncbi:hypothetical protein A1D31_39095 [Bradyrhizobium liaoningense]|nr:hypothetical protein A1D31_39095 [Bradyrhizobium liaoningense]